LISVEDFLNPNLALKSISFAWDNRTHVAQQIQEALPSVKERAKDNFRLILSNIG
jgi:hypothetical protein